MNGLSPRERGNPETLLVYRWSVSENGSIPARAGEPAMASVSDLRHYGGLSPRERGNRAL